MFQTLHQDVFWQVNTNENHFALTHLFCAPLGPEVAAHQLVHALENHFSIGAAQVQNAFVTQHAGAIHVDNGPQEIFQLGRIEGQVRPKDKAFDIVIMMMVVAMIMGVGGMVAVFTMVMVMVMVMVIVPGRPLIQKIRVYIEFGVQIETAQIKDFIQWHFTKMRDLLRCPGVHV